MPELFIAFILTLCGMPAVLIAAQGGSATITGQVTDETGGALPGATVTIHDLRAARGDRMAVADAAGRFTFDQLNAGTYRLTAQLPGFETLTREAVDVGSSDTVRVALAMKVSGIAESVGSLPLPAVPLTSSGTHASICLDHVSGMPVSLSFI